MNLQELQALRKPKRRPKGNIDALLKCILSRKAAKDGKIVYPGKGLTGVEIRARMLNRSFIPDGKGLTFVDEKEVEAIKGMSRIDLMRSHANEKPKLEAMKADLQSKSAAAQKKAQEEAIAKRDKDATDGKG